MMMGAVPTSVPTFILFGNWLLEGRFQEKWRQLKNNLIFWCLSSVFLIHIIGLFWTSNLAAGWDDVKTKAPVLSLALSMFCAKPLSKKELQMVLLGFLLGSFTNTLWCLLYSFVLHQNETIRNASRFMSHIRLGLFLNMAILVSLWLAFHLRRGIYQTGLYILAAYFVAALWALGLASGIVNFIVLSFIILSIVIFRLRLVYKFVAILLLIGSVVVISNYLKGIWKAQFVAQKVPVNVRQDYSPSGRIYYHGDPDQLENGHYVHLNLQPLELQMAWKKIFPADSFSFEAQHNIKRYDVLIRYLASKGLNKDSVGVSLLNETDRENIRNGVVNYQYPDWSYLHRRTYELVNEADEYLNRRQVNGHSLTMRLYFWTAGWQVVTQHPVLGVGTGDVQDAMNRAYVATKSPLSQEWRKRPHNQFLTIAVALGLIGIVVFCCCLIYPVVQLRTHLSWMYWLFFITLVISFITEDTLETQAGLTFFAFFQTLFVSQAWFGKTKRLQIPED